MLLNPSTLNGTKYLLLIDISTNFAQSFVESVLITWLLISELALQFFWVFLNVVVIVAHWQGLNYVVPTECASMYMRFVSAFPVLFMLFVSGSRVSPAILEPRTLPFIDFGLADLMIQLRLRASLTNASLSRFSATSRMSFPDTLLFPGKAWVLAAVPCLEE